ncbi:MAG: addiction module protein [Gammaproteobacteria bacterium]|nr:addiction module protein [Gammaproteobacteria bacterium]
MKLDKSLVDNALDLPPKEKFVLIDILAKSLDEPNGDIEEIWMNEAEKRLESHRQGKTKGVPFEEIFGEKLE